MGTLATSQNPFKKTLVWMISILGGDLSFVGDLGFGGVGNWKYCGGWWCGRICKEPNITPKLSIPDCKYIQPWVHRPSLLSKPYTVKFFCRIKKTCRTMLPGFMQNHARPRNMCKKTRKTRSGQSLMGVFSIWQQQALPTRASQFTTNFH